MDKIREAKEDEKKEIQPEAVLRSDIDTFLRLFFAFLLEPSIWQRKIRFSTADEPKSVSERENKKEPNVRERYKVSGLLFGCICVIFF